jgi:hypothetical protein
LPSQARCSQCRDGLEAQIGARRSWFENTREFRVRRSNAEVDGKLVARGEFFQNVKIAHNESGFRHNAEFQSTAFRHHFQKASRHPHAALDGLVRIGGGAHGNLFARPQLAQILAQQPRGILLDEDEALEKLGVAQFHKFVRIARETVAAAEFASAIRVDGFAEGKAAFGD